MTEKRRDLFHYVRNKKYKIICLEDVHINAQLEPFIKSECGYEVFLAPSQIVVGVMILMNNNFEYKVETIKTDKTVNSLYWILLYKGNELH